MTTPRNAIPFGTTRTGGQKPMDVTEELKENTKDDFLQYMCKTNMSPENHIPCYRRVLSVRNDDYLPYVMRRLSVEGFTAAPVTGDYGYTGWIDMLDMVKYVSNLFWGVDSASWTTFWDSEDKFMKATVGDVMIANRANRPYRPAFSPEPVFSDNSTLHALEIMVTGHQHRVAILDNRISRKLVGIMTQSMLISELTQRMWMCGSLRGKRVDEMVDFFSDIVTVREDTNAINAFNIMAQREISGLAVVNNEGVLTGGISVTDLKGCGINGEKFSRLFTSVRNFKEETLKDIPITSPRAHYSRKLTPTKAIFVTPSNNFEDVIRLMDDGNLHRVFVCSSASVKAGKPLPQHVITQTDVLKAVYKHYTYCLDL